MQDCCHQPYVLFIPGFLTITALSIIPPKWGYLSHDLSLLPVGGKQHMHSLGIPGKDPPKQGIEPHTHTHRHTHSHAHAQNKKLEQPSLEVRRQISWRSMQKARKFSLKLKTVEGFRIWGVGFRGLGFRVQGLGVEGSGLRVQGSRV